MSRNPTIDPKWLDKNVLRNPEVRKALNATARRLAPIVRRIAYQEGDPSYAESVRIEQGVRPGTKSPTGIRRPYSRVAIGDEHAAEKEWGDGRYYPKKGFLRRAVKQL